MSKLAALTLPAERRRGCVFCETFRDVQAVFQNGATVGAGLPVFAPGECYFDNSTFVKYPDENTTITGSGACTLVAEIKPLSVSGNTRFALAVGPEAPGASTAWWIGVSSTNVLGGGLFGVVNLYSIVAPDFLSWYPVAITYAGGVGGVCRFYLSGVSAANDVATGAVTRPNILMGASSAANRTYHGSIRNVHVFDRELSPEEIAAYAAGG